jgi:RecA-family ATPase
MIQFPETANTEWTVIAEAANAAEDLKQRIERGTQVERELERLRIRHEAALSFQAELDADQTPTLEMMTLANFQSNPSAVPVDLIDGVVKQDGLCIMLGPSGSGKSTLGLQMLHSLQTGEDWLGQTAKPMHGSVGVMSYDMDAAMVMDWMNGYPNMDPHKVSVVNAYKRGNPLGVPAMRAQIAEAWKAMNVEVVVIDSFSASFFAHDQNDAAATMHHYRDLKLFALTECEAKALIVIVHSTESSPDKARGSSVHHDVADSIVVVSRTTPADPFSPRNVRMAKYRAARNQHQMSPLVVGAPDPQTHLCDIDSGAMILAGIPLPPSAAAAMFADTPDMNEDPDIDVQEEDDDL